MNNTSLNAELDFFKEKVVPAEDKSEHRDLENRHAMESLRRDLYEARYNSNMYQRKMETSNLDVENLKVKLKPQREGEEDYTSALRCSAQHVAEFGNKLVLASPSDPSQGTLKNS